MGGAYSIQRDEQSVSPVVGVILMVAVVVLLAATVGAFVLGFNEELSTVSGNVKVDFEENLVGMEMTVEAIDTDAEVRLNGETITTVDETDTGRTVLIPTGPGDRITVVSGNDDQSVLVQETADDRDEIGDLVGYYKFNSHQGEVGSKTATDYSNNGNDLTGQESIEWNGNGVFLENEDAGGGTTVPPNEVEHFDVPDITSPEPVDQITFVVDIKPAATADTKGSDRPSGDALDIWDQEASNTGSMPLRAETDGCNRGTCSPAGDKSYFLNFAGLESTSNQFELGNRQQVAVTYDRTTGESKLYATGGNDDLLKASGNRGTISNSIELGALKVGVDQDVNILRYEGEYYEFRIYYEGLSRSEIEAIFNVMDND
jgi:FlaG/FlaF family flagellin (archaellin)